MTTSQKRALFTFGFMILSALFAGIAGGWAVGLSVLCGLWAIGGWIEAGSL
jgi:hypothetical protein